MNSDREAIFSSIHRALEPIQQRAAYPQWDGQLPLSANPKGLSGWERFSEKLLAVHGTPIEGLQALAQWMRKTELKHGYCDPALLERVRSGGDFSGITFETQFDRARVDDYAFGITLATAVIAETGTIVLNDEQTSARLGALAPWVHIALVSAQDILPDIPTALTRLGSDPSVIWVTGPSKTADVEGILIEGVHGPGVQVACLWG